jgi:porphobilinogen synthase
MAFPENRMRRLRKNEIIRRMVQETVLNTFDFIYPMFVVEGSGIREEIKSMPGQFRYSADHLPDAAKEVFDLGIPAVILFGIPDRKDETGSGAYDENGVIQKAVRILKKSVPSLFVICDICMCEYTSHGHCGIIKDGYVDNDQTLEFLGKIAVSQVKAGADMVAPSDMMDGRIIFIRDSLDSENFENIPIMAYSAKYASGFYGPFRDAAESAPKFGDRRSYQMDPPNMREALREIALDVEEGADIIMVKPAMPYLDIVRLARDEFDLPLAAYQVSGEYAMLKAASMNGWLDHDRVMMESLYAIKRAGADLILTYFAKEAARLL